MVQGTAERPRLSVFRSARHIYAQLIDDERGVTLAAASTMSKDVRSSSSNGGNRDAAKLIGTRIAELAKAKDIRQVAFDRNGFRFHGRIKALADAAREAGLEL